MTTTNGIGASDACREVEESLADLLDGTASARLHDHVSDCDACRDLKHEAALVASRVHGAGMDFHPAEGFVDRLIAALETARPQAQRESGAVTTEWPTPSIVVRARDTEMGGGPAREPALESAATVFDPLAAAKASETSVENLTQPSGPIPMTRPGRTREESAQRASSTTEPRPASGIPATTLHGPSTEPRATEAHATEPEKAVLASAPAPAAAPKPARPVASPRRSLAFALRPAFVATAIGAMAAAAAVGFYLKGRTAAPVAELQGPWSGLVASVSRAASDPSGGLDVCDASGACSALASGAAVKPGSTLRTDARTRAHVTLADGTDLAIDRDSQLELSATDKRSARVVRGTIVADVAHVEGSTARFGIPRGQVDVLGTKLAITAAGDRASVEVARGAVRVTTDAGKTVDVRAGEEATIAGGAEPIVTSSATLADTMEWSDDKPENVDAPLLRGLGELRARKPGQTKEKDRAVRLAKHAVKIRIVDIAARTEVDETFTNDTDEELEGIYRFPLPPGAQIEKLALEVDGKLVDGAFVDRDKGAAIWRGVLHNAEPKAPKPREEIVWVPGPWRDPALLEWQRGGRFELKIFPIPKHGSRRVVLTYTQTVEPSAGVRRFTYPLAHDPSGSTKIGAFDLDLAVLGLDESVGLSTRGYDLGGGGGSRRSLHANDFVPAGDLTVEYALPDRDKDVSAWAYAAPPAPPATAAPKGIVDDKAADVASAILDDRSPYVAIAVRPRLPRWQEAKEHLHVLVVDSSRSMFGERFARARALASSIVREMDRRDAFMLLACDTVCRPMTAEAGGAPRPEAPGAAAAEEVERFLGNTEPEGGSDLAAAIAASVAAARSSGALGGKELRIEYLGDGTPSVGPTKPSHLEAAVRGAVPQGDASVVAVALGADADTTSLAALARGGGGVVVPYVPGQRVSTAALDVLGAAYGVVLRDPEIELPAGLSQVSPSRLDPVRAGSETLVVARMTGATGAGEITGDLKLRGRVAGERFEQTYPLRIVASTSEGNAFVPRLYAAAKIAELEQLGGEAQKPTVIELSKRFAVASRYTSLLVLESEAMFKAFGLDRAASAPTFTGEQAAERTTAQADGDVADASLDPGGPSNGAHRRASAAGYGDPLAGDEPSNAYKGDDAGFGGLGEGHGRLAGGGGRGPAPAAKPADKAPAPAASFPADELPPAPPPPATSPRSDGLARAEKKVAVAGPTRNDLFGRRRFVPMRRVFDRHVGFDMTNAFVGLNAAKIALAESALAATPDSRDKTVDLFSLYASSGRVGEAQEITAKWAGRDAFDPDALQARADLAARQGDRPRAIRILGGLADLRPNDRAVQVRLADLWDRAGNAALACEHRIALADMAASDAKLVSSAIACARTQGMSELASALRLDTTDKVRESVDRLLAAPAASTPTVHGDVQIAASWSGGGDLDVALIDAQGKRTSWLGSATRGTVTVQDATSPRDETLAIAGLPQGNYVLEIARAEGHDAGEVARGEVTLRLNGEVRKVPFTLTGARAELGTVRVFFTSHLEPL